MLNAFKEHINNILPAAKECKILIAISGGLDSVVLTHLCNKTHLNITLAHCNFNLRDKESDLDQEFVVQLAKHLEVDVFIENFNTIAHAEKHKLSIQMAARELRYNWFKKLAKQLSVSYIFTAHHADDNLETFLINLSRGTGLEGLTGIPKINNNIARPLLPFSRETILSYAKVNKLQWREDSSNASTKYLRNKLRHDVIPLLKEINPNLLHNFNKTQGFLKDSKTIIDDRINDISDKIIDSSNNNSIHFSIKKIKKLNNKKAYLFEVFKNYGFSEWNDITNLLDAQSGKQIFSKTHRLIKDRKHLILTNTNSDFDKSNFTHTINKKDKEFKTPLGTLFFNNANSILKTKNDTKTIFVDEGLLKFPLTIRKWSKGDFFYPFGMTGKKKLSKYFKDEKLSLLDKESILLLCSGNDIIWILKYRADNRFRVNANTKSILKIELK